MGSWGEGLQANDTALDAIADYQSNLNHIVRHRRPQDVIAVLDGIDANHHSGYGGYPRGDIAALAVTEWLLDRTGPEILATVKERLAVIIANELSEARLSCWRNPQLRRQALENFRKRLDGEIVPVKEVEASNEGLMSRLSRVTDRWYRHVSPTSWVAYEGNKAVAEGVSLADLQDQLEKLGFILAEFRNEPLRVARLS